MRWPNKTRRTIMHGYTNAVRITLSMSNVHYEINVHKNGGTYTIYYYSTARPPTTYVRTYFFPFRFTLIGCVLFLGGGSFENVYRRNIIMWGFYSVFYFSHSSPTCSAERVRFTCCPDNNSVPPVNAGRRLPPLSKFTPAYYCYYINISFFIIIILLLLLLLSSSSSDIITQSKVERVQIWER